QHRRLRRRLGAGRASEGARRARRAGSRRRASGPARPHAFRRRRPYRRRDSHRPRRGSGNACGRGPGARGSEGRRLMRVDASATAITWLPFEALDRLKAVPLELAVAHYDEPPPEVVPDLHELRLRDAFREANELTAWIEVDGGEIVDYGQDGRSLIGDGPELESQQVFFAAVEFPV